MQIYELVQKSRGVCVHVSIFQIGEEWAQSF